MNKPELSSDQRDAIERSLSSMSIAAIAGLINRHWTRVSFGAAPYLQAMFQLNTINDRFQADSGREIVSRFLVNTATWNGEVARLVKTELRKRLGSDRTVPHLTFELLAEKYCTRQDATPDGLRTRLMNQKTEFNPEGWFLLECQMLDSGRLGELTILPYGGKATYQEVPTQPISPRGLASDMSVVIGVMPASALL